MNIYSDENCANTVALRQYEREQDRQDEAWECVLERIKPYLSELEEIRGRIEELKESCLMEADEQMYCFEEQIRESIDEALGE